MTRLSDFGIVQFPDAVAGIRRDFGLDEGLAFRNVTRTELPGKRQAVKQQTGLGNVDCGVVGQAGARRVRWSR